MLSGFFVPFWAELRINNRGELNNAANWKPAYLFMKATNTIANNIRISRLPSPADNY
jgi:hypothetical protein